MKDASILLDPRDLEQVPVERAETIPSAWYTDPAIHKFELESVFTREWQLTGHISQLPARGDSLCRTVAGNPVLIIRTDSDEVKAFYNVCRHRGGPLCVKKGTTNVIQCKYHGWTYLMDGSLRGVPQFDRVELFDKKDFGLKPVKCEVRSGLIFISLNENPPPLEKVLKGISERIHPMDLAGMKYHTSTVDLIECNWKVYADNFLEGYHIPVVHPELAGLLDYKNYKTETEAYYSLQYSPFSDSSDNNPYEASGGSAFYYFIYPNIMLNILPGRLQTNIIEPAGPGRCRVVFDFFYDDPEKAQESGLISNDLEYSARIQREDIEICEEVQKGLSSRAYDRGRFSVKRELGVWHFQSLLKRGYKEFLQG